MNVFRWMAAGCHGVAWLFGLAFAGSTAAHAATNWPVKPVRMVNPYTAGGGVDVVGRTIANQLSEMWGQPVVTDNRPGAGTTIGMEIVAHAPPGKLTCSVCMGSRVHLMT